MPKAKEFTFRDKFCLANGMAVTVVEQAFARATLEVQPQHLNGLGMVHGGAIFTLADLAFAAATNAGEEAVVSINASIAYIKAAKDGILTAEAREISRNAKLTTYEVKVANGQGEVMAVFLGTGYIKGKPVKAH